MSNKAGVCALHSGDRLGWFGELLYGGVTGSKDISGGRGGFQAQAQVGSESGASELYYKREVVPLRQVSR